MFLLALILYLERDELLLGIKQADPMEYLKECNRSTKKFWNCLALVRLHFDKIA